MHKAAIYYLFIAFNRQHLYGGLLHFHHIFLAMYKPFKNSTQQILPYGRKCIPKITFQIH
jgi:hypothetical protein